LVRLLHTS